MRRPGRPRRTCASDRTRGADPVGPPRHAPRTELAGGPRVGHAGGPGGYPGNAANRPHSGPRGPPRHSGGPGRPREHDDHRPRPRDHTPWATAADQTRERTADHAGKASKTDLAGRSGGPHRRTQGAHGQMPRTDPQLHPAGSRREQHSRADPMRAKAADRLHTQTRRTELTRKRRGQGSRRTHSRRAHRVCPAEEADTVRAETIWREGVVRARYAGAVARVRRSDSTYSTSAISTFFVESRVRASQLSTGTSRRDRQRLADVVRRRGTARRRSS